MAKKLNEISGMPQIEAAFNGWLYPIKLGIVTQEIVNGDNIVTINYITFDGVVQPLTAEQLRLKPEGSRSFKWFMIHCFSSSLNLRTNDIILYKNEKYKVMGKWDWSLDGFIEYHICEEFQ